MLFTPKDVDKFSKFTDAYLLLRDNFSIELDNKGFMIKAYKGGKIYDPQKLLMLGIEKSEIKEDKMERSWSREDYEKKELRDRRTIALSYVTTLIAEGKAKLSDLEKIADRMVKFIFKKK